MRPIKFRIWDKAEKKWLFGYEKPNLGGFSLFGETVLSGEFSEGINFNKLDDYVCMQFTRLHDKNGKEIYEGDIVKTETDKPMVVNWNNKFASWCLNRDGWAFSHWFGEACDPEKCEVIGNIHENPELLK